MIAATPAAQAVARPAVRFHWILDRRSDLVFYIGSALAGWAYVGIILYALATLGDPFRDPLGTVGLGGFQLALTLNLLVMVSWAFILDAPHVWATLGRTLLDPGEWRTRGGVLRRSFGLFLLGPAAILLPYAAAPSLRAAGVALTPAQLGLGAIVFFVFFRLWAYYHVVRQHWGFFALYKRKAGEQDPRGHRVDTWFFNLSLYLPLVMFMPSTWYAQTPGFPNLGLREPILAGVSVGTIVFPLAVAAYAAVIAGYLWWHVRAWRAGEVLNGSKLAYMALIVPLHLVAFSHPVLAAFVVPLVTVGHNIQYHCIVYTYARRKYGASADPSQRLVRLAFANVGAYAAAGLLFTFLCYRGPWITWAERAFGVSLDRAVLNSLAMMAGIQDPSALGLGEQLLAAAIVGFALQHYYLDARIWRVSRDADVRAHLRV
jgi:hypothetical protein